LLKIRIIFITHIHSDHNLGILNMISQRNKLMKARNNQEKLFLIIPFNVYNWYVEYCNKIDDLNEGCHVIFTQILNGEEIKNIRTD
jgi:ribonuclease BN (tRNA processing enzyme)